ncbi:MAG: AbrB/MazE/SpoVT family DNA-binding domain-containing protein, partial [Planctomycetaceae bacterium]
MIKNLVKHGNSWALVIDRPILELLKIDPEQPLELTTDGSSIRIATVAAGSRQDKLRRASRKVNTRYK